jgi:hypothetical protein
MLALHPSTDTLHAGYRLTTSSKGQSGLTAVLRSIVPSEEIQINYKLTTIQNKHSIELDIYLPSFSIAFEYQGSQHYLGLGYSTSLEAQTQRDNQKRRICRELGITLVEIPYWWLPSREGLISTIQQIRPDIPLHSLKQIPPPSSLVEIV